MDMNNTFYTNFTNGIYIAMAIWGFFSLYYILKIFFRGPERVNLYIYDGLAGIFTTLGLLGTFVGIYLGLRSFDVHNITESIPHLLTGLKTAFSTSILGIFLSILVGKFADIALHYAEKKWNVVTEDDQTVLLKNLITEFKQYAQKTHDGFQELNKAIVQQTQTLDEKQDYLVDTLSSKLAQNTQILQSELSAILEMQEEHTDRLDGSLNLLAKKLEEVVDNQEKQQENIRKDLAVISEVQTEALTSSQQFNALVTQGIHDILENGKAHNASFRTLLDDKFLELFGQLKESRTFFQEKMETFTALLAKNNTESLVEVMKKTTESFNAQMSALIERLVQENFKELNTSVQNLNEWQHANKTMIASLTQQFTQVSQDLVTTEKAITSIANHTDELTNNNSELVRLINLLKTVMIDDDKFRDITHQLTSVVKTLEDNTQAFDKTTHKLNDWVRKQMTFSDSVEILLTRLEKIDQIKDINDIFWNETKDKLNEGISIIANASQQLEKELDNLNGEFYERLNNTFTNLDMLMQRIVEKYRE
ncbi:MotA/TolQ/ExbB proton channel family protein [Actinobacillus delphinicola]|uniref:MotA/TolQ/ExbB proton channel family protein n=1 Tax=Actinobacillus delphinicola TaxID=51161 RepID=UPI0024419EB3|nr:MotA/TolQ/ExbB proton channel family protein [Actinobacillus delphinicola]